MALVLLLMPAGAYRLIRSAWNRDVVSPAALSVIVLGTAATVVGDAPLWNLRGGFASESSAVFLGGCFALWALARETTADGRKLITRASLSGLAATGVIGCLQLRSTRTTPTHCVSRPPSAKRSRSRI